MTYRSPLRKPADTASWTSLQRATADDNSTQIFHHVLQTPGDHDLNHSSLIAANRGAVEAQNILLHAEADANGSDDCTHTPAIEAASSNHPDILGLLATWKADFNAADTARFETFNDICVL